MFQALLQLNKKQLIETSNARCIASASYDNNNSRKGALATCTKLTQDLLQIICAVNLNLQLLTGCSGEQIAFTADAPDLSGMALCCQMLSPQFCLFNTNMKSTTVSFEAKIDGSGEDRVQKV